MTFLEQAMADVIITHHAPFPQSIEAEFQGDVLNTFLVINIDPDRFPKIKLCGYMDM
ncbi:hypothetical protein [Microvirga yunnanensis]|uniref:hypothetical protein n=1 Tax=Microvirga yunnanensis TaxID=2953740 RepID=UPI0021C96F7D|nr:hypothetical protein [Microvirga sp. HBU65207]